jgi:hypothetical protein
MPALVVAGMLFAVGAWGAPLPGFVYCLREEGLKIFAGRPNSDGSLLFGLSVWSPSGQNISVFGTAQRLGREWQYIDNLQEVTAAQRCRLEIRRGMDGSLSVSTDPTATCQSHGGVNAEIGTVQFPNTAYEGAVTTELDGPEAFQKAGRCAIGTN